MPLDTIWNKYTQEGITGLSEAIWRNSLRRTPVGTSIESLFGEIFVEKLVMAPRVGYWPHIRNPRSFNENIMHRKLFTNKSIFADITDKVSVRSYISSKIGDKILNDVYHISDDVESIPFNTLPNEFVIKTGNKGSIIVDDKEDTDYNDLIIKCRESFNKSFGEEKGEYWYSETNPKYIVEKRLYGAKQDIPIDYKFFVFGGDVQCIQVDYSRFSDHSRRLYLEDWTPLDVKLEYPLGPITDKPDKLDEMIKVAEQLGSDFDFIRVDLYETKNEGIVFGELTVAPGNGGERFIPKSYDFELGKYW